MVITMLTGNDKFEFRYAIRIRLAVFGVILVTAALMYLFPIFSPTEHIAHSDFIENIETFRIPKTYQIEAPPPPSRPSIPIESDEDDFPEDITIAETELDNYNWDGPPLDSGGPNIVFIPYDVSPVPIGGWNRFAERIRYPVTARDMHLSGIVTVQAFITKGGRVTETFVLKGYPGTGLDEAVVVAIRLTRWKPAMQRDKKVGVWISIPVKFELEIALN